MGYADLKIVTNTKFLKLEPNVPIELRLLDSVPVEIYKHQSKQGQTPCPGSDACDLCLSGDAPRQKFITNVYCYNAQRVMLWEFGPAVAKQVKKIALVLKDEAKDIMDVDLRIEASGEGFDREYAIQPRMTSKIPPPGLVLHKIDRGLSF